MDWVVAIYRVYLQYMPLCMISYSEVMCAVHVKYCNHLLAVDMAVWHVYR